jgi:fido (protein-threonine AMPylation protein)
MLHWRVSNCVPRPWRIWKEWAAELCPLNNFASECRLGMGYRGNAEDPYVDPETGILKNLAGIRDAALLEEYEGEMSIIRQFELSESSPASSFDFDHLRAIHRQLFQDVYAWAGDDRTVDLAKGSSRGL